MLAYFSDASKLADNVRDEALASERGGADADFSDDGFASEEGSDVDLLLDGIKDPINRLFKMGVWIRNPTSRFTSPKALGYTMVDTETGIDLLDMFKRYDYDYISALFLEYRKLKAREDIPITEPVILDESKHEEAEYVWEPIRTVLAQYTHELSEDAEPFLVRRIAGANTRRRQLLAYWKVHRQKQGQQAAWNLRTLRPQPQFQGETPSLPEKETASSQAPADSGVLNLNSGLVAPQSVTTASQLDFSRLAVRDDGQSSMSVSEYAASDWRPGKEVLGFPPPPTHPAGTKAFKCPYCFTLCPGALLRERAWKWVGFPVHRRAGANHLSFNLEHTSYTTCDRIYAHMNTAEPPTSFTTVWKTGRSTSYRLMAPNPGSAIMPPATGYTAPCALQTHLRTPLS